MFADARNLEAGQVLVADVCIVGAGAAGITLARELIPSGLRVVVLESGGFEPDADTQDLYDGVVTGLQTNTLNTCRFRYFGGSTNRWAGWCRPLEADVFDDRPGVAGGWPIDAAELEPYYPRANATCGIGAVEFDAPSVAERSGRELLDLSPSRVRQVIYQYSEPVRFGSAYREELEGAADVTVYLHANLTNIELVEAGGAVRALQGATLAGPHFEVQADRYVLAMGGVENARMLLASRDQEPAGVGNERDLVGRYFMEHPHVYRGAAIVARDDVDVSFYLSRHQALTVDEDHPEGVEAEVMPALALAPELRGEEGLLALACQLSRLNPADVDDQLGAIGFEDVEALVRRGEGGGMNTYTLHIRAEQRPLSDSRVTLAEERDPLGIPRATLHWKIADVDRADLRRGLEILGAELGRAGVGRLWMPLDPDGLYPIEPITGGCHHMGTTRMAASADEGVVDANCRVHGLDNLYIAGSSVFASGGHANPTLAIVALAHRLADMLESS